MLSEMEEEDKRASPRVGVSTFLSRRSDVKRHSGAWVRNRERRGAHSRAPLNVLRKLCDIGLILIQQRQHGIGAG